MANNLYTPIVEAVELLIARQKDIDLSGKVLDFQNNSIPAPLSVDGQYGVLFRNICTPDCETEKFIEKCSSAGLVPVFFEYLDDLFVANNEDKHALCKLFFYLNTANNGEINMYSIKIADFNKIEKQKISNICTNWGEKLHDFHHRIFKYYFPEDYENIYDLSEWLHLKGARASDYYDDFFALFIRHAILFDNFRSSGEESGFVDKVVMPCFEIIQKKFGIKPLIVSLQEIEDEDNPKWWGYSKEKMDKVKNFIENGL